MPTNYDGIPGNVTTASTISIASSTNTNPITITVSGTLPADFLTGVKVDISGHQVNTNANGQWAATVTGASTFTIPQTGNGVGGATGLVQPLNLVSLFNYPSDGDPDNQASIASWAQTTGDRTQFLAANLGAYKLVSNLIIFQNTDTTGVTTWANSATIAAANTPTAFLGLNVPWVLGLPVIAGDLIIVDVSVSTSNNWPGLLQVSLYSEIVAPGIGFGAGGLGAAYTKMPASGMNAGTFNIPMRLHGQVVAGQTGSMGILPVGMAPSTTGVYQFWSDALAIATILRPTNMPQ